jgi:hypothetical protein
MFEPMAALLRYTMGYYKKGEEKSDTWGERAKGGYEREKLLCGNTKLLSTDVSVSDVYVKGTQR